MILKTEKMIGHKRMGAWVYTGISNQSYPKRYFNLNSPLEVVAACKGNFSNDPEINHSYLLALHCILLQDFNTAKIARARLFDSNFLNTPKS